jgi:hypothetical protein
MAMEDSITLKHVNGKRGRNPKFIGPTPGPPYNNLLINYAVHLARYFAKE